MIPAIQAEGIRARLGYALMTALVAGRWWAVVIVAVLTLASLLWAFENRSPAALWLGVTLTHLTVVACVMSLVEDASGFLEHVLHSLELMEMK